MTRKEGKKIKLQTSIDEMHCGINYILVLVVNFFRSFAQSLLEHIGKAIRQKSLQEVYSLQTITVKITVWKQILFLIKATTTKPAIQSTKTKQNTPKEIEPGGKFINILCTTLSYDCVLRSFPLIKVWLCDFLAK